MQSNQMALRLLTLALAFAMVYSSAMANSVKGSVSCVDCRRNYNYTGIRVAVTCNQTMKPATMAIAEKDGSFKAKMPGNPTGSLANCQARVVGGPRQLYVLKKNMASNLVNQGETYYTTTTLMFASRCSTLRKLGNCGAEFGSSKTIDFPIPPEYGMPPMSYYMPVLPIIGIP